MENSWKHDYMPAAQSIPNIIFPFTPNIGDMAHTMMLFSHRWVQYAEFQGFLISQEEKECWHHLWTYVGYLIGLEEGSMGNTYDEEVFRYQQIANLARKPDENSRKVTQATCEGIANTPPLYLSLNYIKSGKFRGKSK